MPEPQSEPAYVTQLARVLVHYPARVVSVALALCAVAGLLAWSELGLATSRMALIGEQHDFNARFVELQRDFGDLDAMVVLLRGATREQTLDAAERLTAEVEVEPAFAGSYWRVREEGLRGQALLFLDLESLERIERQLRATAPALRELLEHGLARFVSATARRVEALMAEGAAHAGASAEAAEAGFLLRLVGDAQAAIASGKPYTAPWADWIPHTGQDPHMWTEDGRLVMLVRARREGTEPPTQAVGRLRELLASLRARGVQVGLTGGPVLEVDELGTFRRDATLATAVSLISVTLLAMLAFWRLLGPLLVTVALAIAVILTLGFAALWPGELNLISLAFCALLVGLGTDYGIHLISRFDEERMVGLVGVEALSAALTHTGQAVAAGAFSTALAFLATVFTEIQGIREFAVVAGVGVLLCLATSLAVLPALVILVDTTRGGRRRRPHSRWAISRAAGALDGFVERHPGPLVLASVLLGAASLWHAFTPGADGSSRVHYDGGLLRLQSRELESVRLAGEVLADRALGGMFGAVVVRDLERLRVIEERVRRLPSVARTESILDVVPVQQAEKLVVLGRMRASLAGLPARVESGPGPDLEDLAAAAEDLIDVLEQAARGALQGGRSDAAEWVLQVQVALEGLADASREAEPSGWTDLASWEAALRGELRGVLDRLGEECQAQPVRAQDLPEDVRERFEGRSGELLLRVYPEGNVWDDAVRTRFVTELRDLVPDVGGLPVVFHESDQLLRRGYLRAGRIAFAFLVFFLVVHFRGVVYPLVAIATLVLGISWALGAMSVLGFGLNPANLIALPLTVGIGIDYAIHLIHRHRELTRGPTVGGPPLVLGTSTGRAVLLSSLTTVVAFAALAGFSRHVGIRSIGWTSCLGVAGCLLAALLFCPALLRLLGGGSPPQVLHGQPGPKVGPGGRVRSPRQDSSDESR